jgi:hypothetical protein
VYEVAEPIWLTVRLRRESGEAEVAPEVRLAGEAFGAQGLTLPLPREEGKPVLGAPPRSEAAFRLDLQRTGRVSRPGTHSFTAHARFKDKPGIGVSSPVIRLHVRPAPGGLTWGESHNGLTLSVFAEKRSFAFRDGIPLHIRLKNVGQKGVLTIPWPVCEPEDYAPRYRHRMVDRDSALRCMSFALKDAEGKAADLGPEPKPVPRRPDRWGWKMPPRKKAEPTLIDLLPGQVVRFRASPAWQGRGLRHLTAIDDPAVPGAVIKGGKFALSVTYEVPADAPFPASVWRGSVTAALGEIAVLPPRKGDRWESTKETIDDGALGLEEIRLHEPQLR